MTIERIKMLKEREASIVMEAEYDFIGAPLMTQIFVFIVRM